MHDQDTTNPVTTAPRYSSVRGVMTQVYLHELETQCPWTDIDKTGIEPALIWLRAGSGAAQEDR